MALDRRLEYETSPSTADDGNRSNIGTPGADTTDSSTDSTTLVRLGTVLGTVAFVLVYLLGYTIALASQGGLERPDGSPSTPVLGAFLVLMSHGGAFAEPASELHHAMGGVNQLGAIALVPLIATIVALAGWLVAQRARPRSFESAVRTAAAVVPSYVLLVVATGSVAEHTPDPDETSFWSELEGETVAITVDASLVLSIALFVFAFAFVGVVLASRNELLDVGDPTPRGERSRGRSDDSTPRKERAGEPDSEEYATARERTPSANADGPRRRPDGKRSSPSRAPSEPANQGGSGEVDTDHESRSIRDRPSTDTDHDRYKP